MRFSDSGNFHVNVSEMGEGDRLAEKPQLRNLSFAYILQRLAQLPAEP
jgi:hypothetical protein